MVLLPGVDLADCRLRSGGALEQRRLVIQGCLALRSTGIWLWRSVCGALVGHCRRTHCSTRYYVHGTLERLVLQASNSRHRECVSKPVRSTSFLKIYATA